MEDFMKNNSKASNSLGMILEEFYPNAEETVQLAKRVHIETNPELDRLIRRRIYRNSRYNKELQGVKEKLGNNFNANPQRMMAPQQISFTRLSREANRMVSMYG